MARNPNYRHLHRLCPVGPLMWVPSQVVAENATQNLKPQTLHLSIKTAQKPYIIGFLGPKALKYASFEGLGFRA